MRLDGSSERYFVEALGKARVCVLLGCSLAGGSCLCVAQTNSGEGVPAADGVVVASGEDSTKTTQVSAPSSSTQEKSQDKSENKDEKKKKKPQRTGSFVVAPIPIVSPALGSGIVPVAGYITPIPKTDRAITPSVAGAGGLITNNGTRGFAVGADLFLDKAKYETEAAYARGNLNYNIYGPGFVNGNAGLKLPLEQTGHLFFAKALRHIRWDFYAGIRFMDGSSFITIKPTSGELPPIPEDVGLQTNLRSLGMEAWRDSRPNKFYPLKGSVIDFTGDFFAHNLGSKYSFQSYKFTFNKYLSLGEKQVLAYNFFWCGMGGSPPFMATVFTVRTIS